MNVRGTGGGPASGPGGITRRRFLLGGAGGVIGLLSGALMNVSWARSPYPGELAVRVIERGRSRELLISGQKIPTVSSNGAYRAANFMFAPEPNLRELGKSIAEYRSAVNGS